MARSPNVADVLVGRRLRAKRRSLGLPQKTLAEALGVSYQQLQKYEQGTNRLSAEKLFRLTKVLRVEVNYFFDQSSSLDRNTNALDNLMSELGRWDCRALNEAFLRIADRDLRTRIVMLIECIGGLGDKKIANVRG